MQASNNPVNDNGISFIQLNFNNWSILILKKLHLINNIKVKKSKAFITIIIFPEKKGPFDPPKKIIEPRTQIPKR